MPTSTPPGSVTTLADVVTILDLAETAGVRLWLDGGWGVDALLGGQSREHGDLDVALEARHLDAFLGLLTDQGFAPAEEPGATPYNFLLVHPDGPVVDLHVVVLDGDGNGVLGPPEDGRAFPAASLTGHGTLGGRAVDCISAEWMVRFHDQYPGDANDRADVRAVCDRFGVIIPEQYR